MLNGSASPSCPDQCIYHVITTIAHVLHTLLVQCNCHKLFNCLNISCSRQHTVYLYVFAVFMVTTTDTSAAATATITSTVITLTTSTSTIPAVADTHSSITVISTTSLNSPTLSSSSRSDNNNNNDDNNSSNVGVIVAI